jgi:glyoxylase-like metal-dependent hydrolase (beta-lactamase superfamily II)
VIGGGYQVMAIEFKDHVVLIEAPQTGIGDLIAQVKQAIPSKPITQVVVTHMHFDHVGGLRTALAEACSERYPCHKRNEQRRRREVVQQSANATGFYTGCRRSTCGTGCSCRSCAGCPWRCSGGGAAAAWPDDLQKSGKKIKYQYVKDKLILKDDTNSIEIYPIKGALHSEDMMVIYVPKAKAVFESDAWNPGASGAVTTGSGQKAFRLSWHLSWIA